MKINPAYFSDVLDAATRKQTAPVTGLRGSRVPTGQHWSGTRSGDCPLRVPSSLASTWSTADTDSQLCLQCWWWDQATCDPHPHTTAQNTSRLLPGVNLLSGWKSTALTVFAPYTRAAERRPLAGLTVTGHRWLLQPEECVTSRQRRRG